jgi:hypothetical protein
LTGAEHYGLNKNFNKENKGCTDWEFDISYGQTFGKKAELEYMESIDQDGKTCEQCLYVEIGFCTFSDCYPNEMVNRGAVS